MQFINPIECLIQLLKQLYPLLSIKVFTARYFVILLSIHQKNNEQSFVFVGRIRDTRCERHRDVFILQWSSIFMWHWRETTEDDFFQTEPTYFHWDAVMRSINSINSAIREIGWRKIVSNYRKPWLSMKKNRERRKKERRSTEYTEALKYW